MKCLFDISLGKMGTMKLRRTLNGGNVMLNIVAGTIRNVILNEGKT